MDLLLVGGAALTAAYAVLTARLVIGLGRNALGRSTAQPVVSVVIAARNEAGRIETCLEALACQTYGAERFEILVVDDRSEDETASRAAAWGDRLRVRVLETDLDLPGAGKKRALQTGIAAASGEIILTTDADCRPAPSWIRSTVACFEPDVGLVAGYAPLTPGPGFLGALQAVQSDIANAIAAAGIGAGTPFTCSGRNLAYRRTAFNDAGGFGSHGHIQGGDDVYLLRDVARNTRWRIRFNPDRAAAVFSHTHGDGRISRQLRYQSKTGRLGGAVLIPAGVVYILNLLVLTSPLIAWTVPRSASWLAGYASVKICSELVLLARAQSRFGTLRRLPLFPVVALLLPLYIVVFGGAGVLLRTRWS